MALRKAARLARGIVWSREQESRDDWPRAWKWLEPEFGDCDPKTIIPEHFLRIDPARPASLRGLVPQIERAASVTERHRTIKVWRSLWAKMQAMGGFCGERSDPSKSFANGAPLPRQAIWQRREVLRLVQARLAHGFRGLAACMAVAWDSMFSPIDARTLTPAQSRGDIGGLWFAVGRAKTGKAALGTLTPWSQAILLAYLAGAGVDFHANAPIFRTRGRAALPKSRGGKPGRRGPTPRIRWSMTCHRARAGVRARRDPPARRHAPHRRRRGRRRRRQRHRPGQQDGQHRQRQQSAAQDLQPGERRQRPPLRRGARPRRPRAGTKTGRKCHSAGPCDTFADRQKG
jgi:hypothetical protein